jgi:hypothetical protein
MTLFRPLTFKFAPLFPNEIRISIHRHFMSVEQHLLAVQPGATLLDMKSYMNDILHCYEDEQTYVLSHRPVELEDDLLLHDLRVGQREMIVLVHSAPVEHIPLAFQYVARGNHDPFPCLVLENLTDAHMEHVPSWLEHEAGHIQCIDVSATHPRVNEILSMIQKALPHLPMLQSIYLRRTAYTLSKVEREAIVGLCQAVAGLCSACAFGQAVAGQACAKAQVAVRMEAHVFHNQKKMYGNQLLRLHGSVTPASRAAVEKYASAPLFVSKEAVVASVIASMVCM